MSLLQYIQQHTDLPMAGVRATVALLDQDCTIPFISRYRKDQTGNLDEVQIAAIVQYKKGYEQLEKRKEAISKAMEEQGVLTDTLRAKIQSFDHLIALEDFYLPYKKKRKTKAEVARKNGLEPLAKIIMAQNARDLDYTASKYTNSTVANEAEALEGARHIIAEWINERTDIRDQLRTTIARHGQLETKVVKKEADSEKAQKYKDYLDWEESIQRMPSHRLLAILRAENEGVIRIKTTIDTDYFLSKMERKLVRSNGDCAAQIELAMQDAYKRLLFPSLSNEAIQLAKEKADAKAIEVFANNLKQLLLGAPLGEKRILALDPGFRSGCKLVCLDENGALVHNETIYPHAPQNNTKAAMQKVSSLVNAYKIEAIAIGNGTASRETEHFVKKMRWDRDIQVFVVNEAGASIYSASKIAREEFPNFDVTVRGAVSIGRRLADPLAELVKIDPKSIGVGQYQHDVDQGKLKEELDVTVAHCVNKVGVNVNTASKSLLKYVSGIGEKLAENIVKYREENGAFEKRESLKKVPRLGGKAFQQSAGFLRIKNPTQALDDSGVHPERYALVKRMAKQQQVGVEELIGNSNLLKKIPLKQFVDDEIGLYTLEDIIKELEKPGLDPREKAKVFTFDQNIRTIDDLRTGMKVPGIINNITNFGCFVDIGIKESGLVHISNICEEFISDINEKVQLNQQVIVTVKEVDIARKRIQLSMI